MEKRKGLRAGISSIRQDCRSGGLVSKEGPRQRFEYGGYGAIPLNYDPLQNVPGYGSPANTPSYLPEPPPPVEPQGPLVKSRSKFYTDYEKENLDLALVVGQQQEKQCIHKETRAAYDSWQKILQKLLVLRQKNF